MNGDIITPDFEMVERTNGIYGSNRMTYDLFVIGLAGDEVVYDSGSLKIKDHKRINYDLTQRFPEDALVAILKETQTELPQAHGAAFEFKYNQYPWVVEFILSNLSDVSRANIDAGILKQMLKAYDYRAYWSYGGNPGYADNPNTVTDSQSWDGGFSSLFDLLGQKLSVMKSDLDITSDDYNRVNFSYTASIANVLSQVDGNNVSNREKVTKAYPGLIMREIPPMLELDGAGDPRDVFDLSLRDMVTLHRGAMPGIYGTETKSYGLSVGTLFAMESTAVDVEEKGAVQRMVLI